ncbi:Putative S-adenosyl-L-methionine-dependent methyltransferase [Halomicronema hongdechloris C2206]|uniref:S-adenosyl-L-methionine-dependent methyltransferase n=1 Tax=Halomicronema hongdechloris C2206 TaxID=1641165 RepID=A0A1Z3HR43_9CYAN|nr:Putative S-adenosyl-L-methionine-dependent methyltransferase [Halomicronema hongdechloris C2206]
MSLLPHTPVPYTARIVAAKRIFEQTHQPALFQDPYATCLAGHEVDALLTQWQATAQRQQRPLSEVIRKRTRYVAIRTYFFDAWLQASCHQGRTPQVVILGAGLDTRA